MDNDPLSRVEAPSEYIPELLKDCIPIFFSFLTIFGIVYFQEWLIPESTQSTSTLEILGAFYIIKIAININVSNKNKENVKDEHKEFVEEYKFRYVLFCYLVSAILLVGLITLNVFLDSPHKYLTILDFLGIFFIVEVGIKLLNLHSS